MKLVTSVQSKTDDAVSGDSKQSSVVAVDSTKLTSLLEKLMDRMDVFEQNQQATLVTDATGTRWKTPAAAVPLSV